MTGPVASALGLHGGATDLVSSHRYDVVGIGNAIVDVISQESEDFVGEHDLVKGAMTLIDADRAYVESGGSFRSVSQ